MATTTMPDSSESTRSTNHKRQVVRMQYPSNLAGLDEVLKATVPLLAAFKVMGFDEMAEMKRKRELVKKHAKRLKEAPDSPPADFQQTIGTCISLSQMLAKEIDDAFQAADGEFDDLAADIRKRSPERLRLITDELARLQTAYRGLEDNASLQQRAEAYGQIFRLLHDTIEEIDREEERVRQQQELQQRGSSIDRSLEVF